MDFKGMSKIQHLDRLQMTITQKIHGTNAHVLIVEKDKLRPYAEQYAITDVRKTYEIYVGARTRWITPEDDNYGFAAFVHKNKDEFIEKLGPGHHFGEWAGPGINSGEGLSEKTFVLFNHRRWKDKPLPQQTTIVPVLYTGRVDMVEAELVINKLKRDGSMLSPGFMKPEGIVVEIGDQLYKKVFDPEETGWKRAEPKQKKERDVSLDHLLQPIRLEKLLSRDESYIRQYPKPLPNICRDYMDDLAIEGQLGATEDEIDAHRKRLSSTAFHFIKTIVAERRL